MFGNEYFSERLSTRKGWGGGRRVSQMQTAADKGEGGQKSLKMCGHPLWMVPYRRTSSEGGFSETKLSLYLSQLVT